MRTLKKRFLNSKTKICFELDVETKMVNATKMAAPYGKSTNAWLRNKTTKAFIEKLKRDVFTTSDFVIIRRGGFAPGIWLQEELAVEFARWLDPDFAIELNAERIFIENVIQKPWITTEKNGL